MGEVGGISVFVQDTFEDGKTSGEEAVVGETKPKGRLIRGRFSEGNDFRGTGKGSDSGVALQALIVGVAFDAEASFQDGILGIGVGFPGDGELVVFVREGHFCFLSGVGFEGCGGEVFTVLEDFYLNCEGGGECLARSDGDGFEIVVREMIALDDKATGGLIVDGVGGEILDSGEKAVKGFEVV